MPHVERLICNLEIQIISSDPLTLTRVSVSRFALELMNFIKTSDMNYVITKVMGQ
jgi:hypothetical protein